MWWLSRERGSHFPGGIMEDRSVWVRWGFRLALLAAVISVMAVLGLRLGVMPLGMALFVGLGGGFVVALVAILLSLVGLVQTLMRGLPGRGIAFASVFLALAIVAPVGNAIMAGSSVPPIHDISTDLSDVPVFVAVRAHRVPSDNALDRTSPEGLADMQRAAYPDLVPAQINDHPGMVFEKAVDVARAMGWDIVSVAVEEGRIEATATTAIMGFKDDIVIRVRADGEGSVVDVRSASRVGESDLGANARRIRAFLTALTVS